MKNTRDVARVMAVYSQRCRSMLVYASGGMYPMSMNTFFHCPPCALWQVTAYAYLT